MKPLFIILILTGLAVAGWQSWTTAESAPNKYQARPVPLDSDETCDALKLLRQLAESTNRLDRCMSPKASPMARLEVLKWASQVGKGAQLELRQAEWRDAYFSVGVKLAGQPDSTRAHYFYMAKGPGGKLQLIGAQN
jgi:hypothetical protein